MESHEAMPSGEWTAESLAALLGAVRFRPSARAWRRSTPRGCPPEGAAPTLQGLGLILAMFGATGLLIFAFWEALVRLER